MMTGVQNIALVDVYLLNTSYDDPSGEYSMFMFKEGRNLVISNLTAQKHIGSMFVMSNMITVNINNCHFAELMTSKDSSSRVQSFLNLTVVDSLNEKDDVDVTLIEFNVNVISMLYDYLISLGVH